MSYFCIWLYHKRVSILWINWGMSVFSSVIFKFKYEYFIMHMYTLCMKVMMSSFSFAICTYSCIILYTSYVHLVNEGCDGLFLLGDELHHARVSHLFVINNYFHKAYVYLSCMCVCVWHDWMVHMRGMTYCSTCVHDSFSHVCATPRTCLGSFHTNHKTRYPYVRHDSFIHMCDMTYSFVCMPWLIHRGNVCHDQFMCV